MPLAADASSPLCPKHPGRAAVASCSRCGTFLCEACAASVEPALCDACKARRAEEGRVITGPFDFASAFQGAVKLFAGCVGKIAVVCAVLSVPAGLIEHFVPEWAPTLVSRVWDVTGGLVGTIACVALMAAFAEGRAMTVGESFREGFRAWGRVFAARFAAGIRVLLWSLLLVVPGIWKAVRFSFVTAAAYLEPGNDAPGTSEAMVENRWWVLFAMYLVGFLAAMIPTFVLAALAGAVGGWLPGAGVAVAILTDWIARFALTFLEALMLAAWFGLKNTERALYA